MIERFSQSIVCWAIVLLTLVCYQQLFLQWLNGHQQTHPGQQSNNEANLTFNAMLIATLPLLGLLGTIIGLLECFAAMANPANGGDNSLLSGGIGDALLTTQLGLVCAIPGWLFMAWLRSRPSQFASFDPSTTAR